MIHGIRSTRSSDRSAADGGAADEARRGRRGRTARQTPEARPAPRQGTCDPLPPGDVIPSIWPCYGPPGAPADVGVEDGDAVAEGKVALHLL